MTTISFSIGDERLKKILKLKDELNLNMSQTISMLVQRGIAYTELLRAQEKPKNDSGEILNEL